MSSRSDIQKAFDDATKARNHSGLVGHWASADAWLKEVKLRGVSDSVTEQEFNAAMKAHRPLSRVVTKK